MTGASAARLLDDAEAAGLRLALDPSGRVRVRGKPPPDLLATLRADRDAIAAELRRRDLVAAMAERAEALEGIVSAARAEEGGPLEAPAPVFLERSGPAGCRGSPRRRRTLDAPPFRNRL